ncbi:hypothetical protein CDD81_6651 [Ophiocordyceps australis]|uniref:Bys1 family protein n=1 Tax=Ophiocordyceps australis TaxID=1399860 RepID=A0A2C5Y7L1_9HYPO|nr:hypothetical protein CDD81_6651 [Ophiocordyceps australis]
MLKLTIFTIATALAGFSEAVGNARVVNNCGFPVTLWSVGSYISDPHTLSPRGGSYSEVFTADPRTGGRALKITRQPDGLYNGSPQTIYAYSLSGDRVFYDLSDVFGDAFAGNKLVEASTDRTCPVITWPNGTPPAGSQVKNCGANSDITLTLCAN